MALPALGAFANSGSIVTRITHNGDLADSVGANTLTNNNITFASGGFGVQHGVYNGSTAYGTVADAAGNSFTGDLSIMAMVNRSANPASGTHGIIVAKYNSVGNQRSFAYGVKNNAGTMQHYVIMSVDGSATVEKAVNMSNAATGEQVCLGCSYDASAGSIGFWEDGVKIGSDLTGLPTGIFNSTAPLRTGMFGNIAQYLAASVQDLVIWTADQSDADMTANYDAYFTIPFLPRATFIV